MTCDQELDIPAKLQIHPTTVQVHLKDPPVGRTSRYSARVTKNFGWLEAWQKHVYGNGFSEMIVILMQWECQPNICNLGLEIGYSFFRHFSPVRMEVVALLYDSNKAVQIYQVSHIVPAPPAGVLETQSLLPGPKLTGWAPGFKWFQTYGRIFWSNWPIYLQISTPSVRFSPGKGWCKVARMLAWLRWNRSLVTWTAIPLGRVRMVTGFNGFNSFKPLRNPKKSTSHESNGSNLLILNK